MDDWKAMLTSLTFKLVDTSIPYGPKKFGKIVNDAAEKDFFFLHVLGLY